MFRKILNKYSPQRSTTYIPEGIWFQFSSEQDYKVGLNYFKFKKIEYYIYHIAENTAYGVLLRELLHEVTAEMILSELKHLEYPIIHVRQLRRRIYNENPQQSNSLF
jgi:hypothetical protein